MPTIPKVLPVPSEDTAVNLMSDDINAVISKVLGVDLMFIDEAVITLKTGEPVHLETKSRIVGRMDGGAESGQEN